MSYTMVWLRVLEGKVSISTFNSFETRLCRFTITKGTLVSYNKR